MPKSHVDKTGRIRRSKTEHGGSEFGVPTAAITEGKTGANDE